jgi:uncharacterized protein YecE (DUF72 family)
MEFGQILDPHDLEQIKFKLPELKDDRSLAQLERIKRAAEKSSARQQLYLGVPIWAETNWVGSLYPSDTPSAKFLEEYAKQFSTVEVNSTFYSVPKAEVFERWQKSVPDHFRFCPKFPKAISHHLNATDLNLFAERISILGANLGVCFLQLPPWISPDAKSQLEDFFQKIPRSLRTVIEFRNSGFFDQQQLKPEWVELLAKNFLGTVICDTPEQRNLVHTSLSSLRVMIRFLGSNLHATDFQRLDQWVPQLKNWLDHGLKDIYFLAHEPNNVVAPEAAIYLAKNIQEKIGNQWVQLPKLFVPEQVSLF